MKKTIILIANLSVSLSANAIDLYGLNPHEADSVLKKYGKEISNIELKLQKDFVADTSPHTSKKIDQLIHKRMDLMDKIKKEKGYLLVDFQTIFYPYNNVYYSTIEIVDKNNPQRMRFVNAMNMKKPQEKASPHSLDLIGKMDEYAHLGMDMLFRKELGTKEYLCPVYHCIVGFDHPKLKPYLKEFNHGVIQQKKLILQTLNQDKNPERRTAAAFLVGHFQDPKEIISVLFSHVNDKDDGVRNAVMRVIATTMQKSKISDVDVMPFINALDSPYITDRNKALLVLSETTVNANSKKLILQKGGEHLISLLRLKQPNNHDAAYIILKKISGKDFGSTNVKAWSQWVAAASTPHTLTSHPDSVA